MRLVFLTVAVAAATAVAAPILGNAQGVPQTVQLTKVDVIKVATGFRASKVIGSSVVNDAGDTVGKVAGVTYAGDNDDFIGKDGVCAPIFRGCLREQQQSRDAR